MQFRIFRNNNQ